MKYETNTCVCGAQDAEHAFPIADWNFASTSETGVMLRCSSCGSLFPDRFPEPASIPLAYLNYYTSAKPDGGLKKLKRRFLEYLQGSLAVRHLPTDVRKVLDYGCGSGSWLTRMRSIRPDLDLAGCDIAKPNAGSLEFRWIEPTELQSELTEFDWITLSHVLEHLKDPRQTIATLVQRLAPGGCIWIATPNAESYLFNSLKGKARDADFPRHRQVFSRQCLTELLQKCGLEVEFLMPPRINAILNLKSSLTALDQPTEKHQSAINPGLAIKDTLFHLMAHHVRRSNANPEHIVIAKAKS